jgi:hypothetical protein
MSFDLRPVNPAEDAPRDEHGVIWGLYNIAGWEWMVGHLKAWNVDVSEFRFFNDGALISEGTCKKVADAIEQHLPELSVDIREWIEPRIKLWRTCGGYEQW